MMLAGVLVIGVGSGLYLGARLGPGPRDGLMTGIHGRFGWSVRRARTAVEVVVLVVGFLLGGTVGIGTVVFAFGIGPVVQVVLRVFDRGTCGDRAHGPGPRGGARGPGTVGE